MNSVYKSKKIRNQSVGREYGKIRVIAVYRMILENDEITTNQIMQKLQERYGIACDRKTIFSDIVAIDHFIPIDVRQGVKGGYRKHIFEELET
jgi:predicted DNA-binding transcriptional regulator YafY